jgi:hypothetical protein
MSERIHSDRDLNLWALNTYLLLLTIIRVTNSMEQSPSSEANSHSAGQIPAFYGARREGSLPCSQEPATATS